MDFSLRYCRSVHWIKCQFYCNNRCDANITFNGPDRGSRFWARRLWFRFTKRSLKTSIATLVGLLVSTIYFMLVRSKKRNPNYYLELHLIFTIFLLPFFGGLVGAIAITRVERQSIPGVAIATALCLPLYSRIWSSIG
jgi:hypothetical protein